jgi:hypothetical protein
MFGEIMTAKTMNLRERGAVVALSIFPLIAPCAASAETLYTNTWANTEGVSVVKNFGDAANWSVAYDPGVTPPASAVPGENSKALMKRNASITLQNGDDVHLGETYFLADGTRSLTLNFKIPTGASLSLDGTNITSHMNTSKWVDGGVKNYATIDVDGGSFTLGQKIFNMRGNTAEAWNNAPVNHIIVRNGGTMSVTNGYVRLWGGSSALSDGKGLYTNIIDVLEGSTLNLSGPGRIAFSSSHDDKAEHYYAPWTRKYFGGGWVNVKGGKILVKDSTTDFPIVINGHYDADMGACLNVTDGGEIDLGGKSIYIGSQMKKVPVSISVTGGGVITNGSFSIEDGATEANSTLCIDVNNGKIYLNQVKFGIATGNMAGRPTFRVHGVDSTFCIDAWNLQKRGETRMFVDMRLKAHTDRDADFAIRPIRTRLVGYTFPGGNNVYVHGFWRLSPDGGFQMVHKNYVELLCRKHDGQGEYQFTSSYGGLIGDEMWQTNCVTLREARWQRYTPYEYAYVFRVSLKDEAKLTDGVALAQPKPRAWLPLPTFTAREVDPDKMKRVSVRLDLVAPEGGELDLDGVVERMRTEGGQDAYADSTVAGYNVRVDLPIEELAANVANDKIVMDFVSCDLYPQAAGLQPMTTNALIRAATCEKVKRVRGLRMSIR